jgi:hypothetical protein
MLYWTLDQTSSKFENFVEHVITHLHAVIAVMQKNGHSDKMHEQLVEYLEKTCATGFQTAFRLADYKVFKTIRQKTTSMKRTDRLRRTR